MKIGIFVFLVLSESVLNFLLVKREKRGRGKGRESEWNTAPPELIPKCLPKPGPVHAVGRHWEMNPGFPLG